LTIDERLRLNIHTKLTELLGGDEADALIAHIMPIPSRDVATADDLRVVEAVLRTEIAHVHTEITDLRTALSVEPNRGLVARTRWLAGSMTGLVAVVLTAACLLL
jgi:hypothetical protein